MAPSVGSPRPGDVTESTNGAAVRDNMVSTSTCSRGISASTSNDHVDANASATARSSFSSSRARERRYAGSHTTKPERAGSTSSSVVSSSTNHASQFSMPSNSLRCAMRSHCSRPHGSLDASRSARITTRSSITSSRAGYNTTSFSSSVLRWSLTEKVVTRSTSSPHNSTRTGASSVELKMSKMAPRRANSPRCSTSCSRT